MAPDVGVSRPPMMRSRVDFPPPEGPMMASADTSSSKVMSRRTSTPSKDLHRWSKLMRIVDLREGEGARALTQHAVRGCAEKASMG